MKNFARLAALAAAATIVATPALAVGPVTTQASSKAKILKALNLRKDFDLDFGTIVVGAVVGTDTVTVTQSGRTCGTGGELTCSTDPSQAAQFNVQGSNNQLVTITVPDTVTMTNGGSGSLVVDLTSPTSLTLTSSGTPGDDFYVEGSVDLAATTPEGDYTVDFDVTVEY